MGLLEEPPDFDLYDRGWLIHTQTEERAARPRSARGAHVVQS